MNPAYKPNHFQLFELVDKETFSRGEQVAWWCLDARLLWTADQLREMFGPAICNTYGFGGLNEDRGFRSELSTVGSVRSQHRFGRALDLSFVKHTAEEIREDMRKNPTRDAYRYIGGIENSVSWLHVDVRANDGIRFFNP